MNDKLITLQEAHEAILADHADVLAQARALIDEPDTPAAINLLVQAEGIRRAAVVIFNMIRKEASA